jgi:hypothetical protein
MQRAYKPCRANHKTVRREKHRFHFMTNQKKPALSRRPFLYRKSEMAKAYFSAAQAS